MIVNIILNPIYFQPSKRFESNTGQIDLKLYFTALSMDSFIICKHLSSQKDLQFEDYYFIIFLKKKLITCCLYHDQNI